MLTNTPKIIVDTRESDRLKKMLVKLGCNVIEEFISPADYVISEGCAIERKKLDDFVKSIYDGRLFEQVERMAKVYEKSILIVEGNLQSLEHITNPAVFWGALTTILAGNPLSVIFTSNSKNTALFLYNMCKKIQSEKKKRIIAKHKPKVYTLSQRQLLTVQSLPNIGPERAKKLLEYFKSVRQVFHASDREILSIDGFGKKTVQEIKKVLDTKYPGLDEPY